MKTLNLDWGLFGATSVFYLMDSENLTVKSKSVRVVYVNELVDTALGIVKSNPDIVSVNIMDICSYGSGIMDSMKEGFKKEGLTKVEVNGYKFMQM